MTETTELKRIIEPILDDLKVFQDEFELALKSEVRLINVIARYLLNHKGKAIRPILTILTARVSGGPTVNSYKAAAMVELLHLATLMHDDVVDEAKRRRGFPTIHKIWKNKTAIIMGDFILSQVLTNLIRLRDFEALDLISDTAKRLSSGEMLQIESSFKKSMSEETYFKMVQDKTASLISTCCELGVITTSKDDTHQSAAKDYGEKLGVAFQIKDDLFDILGASQDTGKDANKDVTKNMITLPIIHTLSSPLSRVERRQMKKTLSNGARGSDIARLKNIVSDHGGFDYTKKKLQEFSDQAIGALAPFPDSPYKRSMVDLCLYNVQRTR
ncbi:MAG: polyprenyl synthetase [Candidatus Marinimicrobia bacterium]|nr:polyprenyl synthetase [Candidatus Neomarinimicrobiota bacterium]|tara:strand:+ start:3236 stop:4222 length:987 start_codon:yes stop_codon:yes gene_type:complete